MVIKCILFKITAKDILTDELVEDLRKINGRHEILAFIGFRKLLLLSSTNISSSRSLVCDFD